MAWKSLASLMLTFFLALPVHAQQQQQQGQEQDDVYEQPQQVALPANTPNKVPGLSLPPSFSVPFDEGFVTVKAECSGPVDWVVLTTAKKVKYKAKDKEVDISIPPLECTVTVFAYGYVGSKLTRAARCDIQVVGPKDKPEPSPSPAPTPAPVPPPVPGPDPTPVPVQGNLIVTVVEDPLKRDLSYTTITKWFSTAAKLQAAGHRPFLKSIRDPAIKNWLDTAAAKDQKLAEAITHAGLPMMILQDARGKPLAVGACPRTEAELFSILQGGK